MNKERTSTRAARLCFPWSSLARLTLPVVQAWFRAFMSLAKSRFLPGHARIFTHNLFETD
jgi:hypothetical protein